MTTRLIAEFAQPESIIGAIRQVRAAGHRARDAFTPFPVEDVAQELGLPRSRLRFIMLLVGVAVAVFAYALQWYSAVIDLPINSGGRPLNSWPVFLLAPFEVGVFAAALAGFVTMLWQCGLPRLHDAVFTVPGFERATQDRFFLLAEARAADEGGVALRHLLQDVGALAVTEVREG